ncbi:hypothetical protein ES703_107272 [subsurface metagenome]
MDACPDEGDEDGDQHDDPDGEHDEVLHQAVVEEGFLVVGLEDDVYRVDQVGEEETCRNKRAGQSEPTEAGYVL